MQDLEVQQVLTHASERHGVRWLVARVHMSELVADSRRTILDTWTAGDLAETLATLDALEAAREIMRRKPETNDD